MLYKIETAKLRPGMYIADTGDSWLNQPYLYTVPGELTEWELARLLREGYSGAFVDLSHCRPGSLPPHLETLASSCVPGPDEEETGPMVPAPTVSLEEELPRARAVFRAAMAAAKALMRDARAGTPFARNAAEPLLEDIIGSLNRNADALFCLCKLRRTDEYTYTHCVNVSVLVAMFARSLKIDSGTMRAVALGGLLHDVGKAMIPREILMAPRRLTEEEMGVIRTHPLLGHAYLQDFKTGPREVFQAVLEHHEQYCGAGYPRALPEEKISLAGRVVAVADVFDALTSQRVYRAPIPLAKALSILYSMAGRELFPNIVERFIRLVGVYPLGSTVELEDGSVAVVTRAGGAHPARPEVALVRDGQGRNTGNRRCDLAEQGSPGIVRVLSPAEAGVDPAQVLGAVG